jgi:type VI secretion system protein ImpG
MDKLLPYYERELALLQREAEDFARRHPHIAGRLSASGELLQDQQVQRLLQAFAWLGARVHTRLDDDFPRLSHALLEQLSPQWLRPFPACAIAHFHNPEAAATRSTAEELPPGTLLDSIPLHQSEPLRFATTAPVQLLPLHVAWAGMTSLAQVPADTLLPRHTAALFSVRLELLSTQACWGRLGVEHIRLFLDGAAPLVALLREALTRRVLATLVQPAAQGPWRADATACPRPVGLAPGEALIADGWPAAHRLLAEYFNFPAKFNFIDLPLPLVARQAQGSALVLHFALAALRGDEREALEQAGARHLRPGCVPVINLFTEAAETQAVKPQPGRYTVRAQAHSEMHEVHAITRVQYRRPGDGEGTAGLREVEAFHSLQRHVPPDEALYWIARRDDAAARCRPGHEVQLELVDAAQAPNGMAVAALEVQARFTHGERPSRMPIGRIGGDLVLADGGWSGIWLLRPPTPSRRFDFGGDRAWQLLSQLRPRHLVLSGPGLEAFRAGLCLFDWTGDAATARLLDGLAGIELHPAQACMAGPSGPGLVRGSEIRLRVREAAFAERGLHLFAQVLSPCFALQVHANSFTQLRLVSADTGETLAEGPRCRGELPLL